MANLAVISLNSGKLTPLIDVRSDIEKYSGGCRILDNMIPRIYGPVVRRPGTKYIANVADSDVKSRIVPFIFSSTIAYILEFSDQVINVYFDGTLVDSNIISPYLESDLFQLQFRQSADVLWIVHPLYAPRKLSRISPTEFSLDTITFDKGPFIERNDIVNNDGLTIAVTGYTIATASTGGGIGVDNFTIEGTDSAEAITIAGLFLANKRFYVTASSANDGAYTVNATIATTVVGTTVTIYANEAISDGTSDGQIMIAGGTVTLSASSPVFTAGSSGHVGALFKITHNRLQSVVKGSAAGTTVGVIDQSIDVKGSFTFTTHGNWDATIELQRLADGINWETFRSYTSVITNSVGSRNIQKVHIEESDNIQYRMNVITHDVSSTINADISVDDSTQDSIFRITATASTMSATAACIVAAPDNVATTRWAEGAWSPVRGYPSAVTFFGERIVYGFTESDQQNIWLSEVGKFEDFESGINDADAFTITVPTANRGRWLAAIETLVAGTSGDEWRIRATTIDAALTPQNWEIKKQTGYGSADIQAIEVNEVALFVDSVARKIREYTFNDAQQKYISPDLTALAEDITAGGITSIAIQKNPDSIIWFTIADNPYLVSMTYEREQNVVAFANHPLGGNAITESVCVIPGTSEDIITLSANRTIDNATVRTIEQMQPRDWGNNDANAFFVDGGIIDIGGVATITGLTHLEGETVSVLVDGAVQADKIVSNGQITIDEAGSIVHVGLPFTYRASPMRLDITTAAGLSHGSIKKISEIVVSFHQTSGAQYGDDSDTYDIDWRSSEDFGSAPALFTGDKTFAFDGGFSTEDNIIISRVKTFAMYNTGDNSKNRENRTIGV